MKPYIPQIWTEEAIVTAQDNLAYISLFGLTGFNGPHYTRCTEVHRRNTKERRRKRNQIRAAQRRRKKGLA
jgi:hypothetical protein